MRQNRLKTQDIVVMYTQQHLTMRQIAKLCGLSAAAVLKRLRSVGITSSQGEWVNTQCGFCGKDLKVRRAKARKNIENYCSTSCYAGSRANPNFHYWRHGTRLARLIVGMYFKLTPEMIVHHKDGDDRNNNLTNLAVFANQSDHMKHHHGKRAVTFIWDGAIL